VLEHIEDDAGALRAWRERLRPDGRLLMSVPLYQRRYAAADRFVGTTAATTPDRSAISLGRRASPTCAS
jgi:2-polyprenyl-3-methyl-5-hydroxy-6-metoxy-1,4-benzoquinol methylase